MKTNLFLLGMAVAAFSSCTNEEVTDVAQNRAIKFNQFVENNTRQVTELDNNKLNSFYVFGKFRNAADNYDTQIFNNESQSAQYYWQAGKFYSFGAYADGDKGQLTTTSGVSFDADKGKLTFANYTPDDAKDLVAAVIKMQCKQDASQQEAVNLTFHHMLSQVKFTFNTTDAESYTLNITNLTLHAAKTGTGTYSTSGATWISNYTPSIKDNENKYIYNEVVDVSDTSYEAQSKLVIPQATTEQLKVTFTATITGAGLEKNANFEATLEVNENIAGISDANTWMPGYCYNYTATINGDNIDPNLENQKIKFTPTVEPWQDATDTPVGPQISVVP